MHGWPALWFLYMHAGLGVSFSELTNTVVENADSVSICTDIVRGSLADNVEVRFGLDSLDNGTAGTV